MGEDKFRPGIVFVTTSDEAEARRIADALVSERLAACVKILPLHSTYRWRGQVCHEEEWQMLIKTCLTKFEAITTRLKELHSYEVPEAVACSLTDGSPAYLAWMRENLQF